MLVYTLEDVLFLGALGVLAVAGLALFIRIKIAEFLQKKQ